MHSQHNGPEQNPGQAESFNENQNLLQIISFSIPEGMTLNPAQAIKMQALTQSWVDIQARGNYYANMINYADYQEWWQHSSGVSHKLTKIYVAISALKELFRINPPNKDEIADVLFKMLEIELLHFKIKQLRKIEKDQGIPREEINSLQKIYDNLVYQFEKDIDTKKYSEQFTLKEATLLHTFFSYHERFAEKLKRFHGHLTKTSDVVSAATAPNNIISAISASLPSVLAVSGAASTALSGIPAINAILIAVPLVIAAARTWLKNQSNSKKAVASIAAIVVIGGVISAGLITVAAAGIVCGLMTLGVVVNNVLPWWNARKMVIKRENELNMLEKRIPALLDQYKPAFLTERDKNALLIKMEEYYVKSVTSGLTPDMAKLAQAKKLVLAGNASELMSNEIVNLALQDSKCDLKEFLINGAITRRIDLNKEIAELKYKRNMETVKMVNGLFSICGAILLCIPTPPTMIAGAALLTVSSLAGLTLKYELHIKARNFMRNLLGKNTKEKIVENDGEKLKPQHKALPKSIPAPRNVVRHAAAPVPQVEQVKEKILVPATNDNKFGLFSGSEPAKDKDAITTEDLTSTAKKTARS